MKIAFRETLDFTPLVEEYFGGDEAYRNLQEFLTENPERGTVIPGTGGLRKIRWPDPRRGKGKRGGLRVVYIYVPQVTYIGFVDVYDKNEADDLTSDEKKILAQLAERLRNDLLESGKESGE